MSWFKLDDQFPNHPKVRRAGTDAAWLFVAGGCYCAQYLTDGMIPKEVVPSLTSLKRPVVAARALVSAGLWIDHGEEYEVHDYLTYNPTRAKVTAERESAAARRKKGGRASADVRANGSKPVPVPDDPTDREDSRGEPFESDFDQLWRLYPRKVDRAQAFAQYQARRRDGVPHEAMLQAVEAYAEASDGQDRQFVKHGATFLGKRGSWSEWVDGAPADALSNASLGATPLRAPEPPSGPTFVEVEQGPRPVNLDPWVCAVGNPGCDGGFIDREPGSGKADPCECRRQRASA